jgi:hypothetical protein
MKFQNLWNLINDALKKLQKYFKVFFTIFQSSMGLGKSRCDIPKGTTKDGFAHLHVNSKLHL